MAMDSECTTNAQLVFLTATLNSTDLYVANPMYLGLKNRKYNYKETVLESRETVCFHFFPVGRAFIGLRELASFR